MLIVSVRSVNVAAGVAGVEPFRRPFSPSGGWCEFSIRLLEYLERRCSTRCDLLAVGDPVAVEFVGDAHPRRILRPQRLKPQHTMPPSA